MKQKGFWLLGISLVLLLFSVSFVFSGSHIVNDPKDFYFGHISYIETRDEGKNPLVYREGQQHPETAVVNLPLGPGDAILTSDRRCEIQFDSGTIVRLDFNTEVMIETILAQSLSTRKKLSNLLLQRGRVYVMYKQYISAEILQIIAPRAAIKLDQHTVALIMATEAGSTEVQVERGKAHLLYGAAQNHIHEKKAKAKEKLLVTADHSIKSENYETTSDFKAWNDSVNENFNALHEGSFLPKPIQKMPAAVFYFAQKYGNAYGEWLWHDLYGYVWRPYFNDFYPWGSWQPYICGSWASYRGQLFWIPNEPWGWVPFHLGIWIWDKNKGWVWLPGSLFAPAWVVWNFYFGNYFWRPMTLVDWYYGYNGIGFSYLYLYEPGEYVPVPPSSKKTIYSINRDQLKKKNPLAFPMPKEMKKAYQATITALNKGDERVLASLRELPRQTAIVNKGDISSPKLQEKLIRFEQISRPSSALPKNNTSAGSEAVSRDALRAVERSRAVSEVGARMMPSTGRAQGFRPNFAAARYDASSRFRDWNPDIRAALMLGLDITYSSRTNEIVCPQLGLSSRDIGPGMRMGETSLGSFSAPGSYSEGTSSAPPSGRSSGSDRQNDSSTSKSGSQKEKN